MRPEARRRTKRQLKIAFVQGGNERQISHVVINGHLNEQLGRFAELTRIPFHFTRVRRNMDEVFRKLREIEPDFVYVDNFRLLMQMFLQREIRALDLPYVFTVHTIYHWIDRYVRIIPLLRPYDVIVAPSRYARRAFRRLSGGSAVHVVPYAVDVAFIRRHCRRRAAAPTLAYLGRISRPKGIRQLIETMPQIRKRCGPVRLEVIGPLTEVWVKNEPPSPFVKRLQNYIRRKRLRNQVRLRGVRFGAAKYRLLSKAHLFINPTVAPEETFGIVNVEAFACGLPIVATRWAANRELIRAGRTGEFIDIGRIRQDRVSLDKTQLVALVERLLKDRQRLRLMRREAFARARVFDYRAVMPRFIRLLERVRSRRVAFTEEQLRERWGALRSKRAIDFRHLFSRQFLFYLYLNPAWRSLTYGQIANELFFAKNTRGKVRTRRKHLPRRSPQMRALSRKLREDLFKFLTLRSR